MQAKKLVLALGLMIVSVLSAMPAKADTSTPVIFDVHSVRHAVFMSCGSFLVNVVAPTDSHFEQFFNDAGQLVLERRHVVAQGTLTNATTGASLPYEADYTRTADISAGVLTVIGVRRKTEVPGQGVLAIAAGRLVIDLRTFATISETGQTDESYNATICSLLA